MCYHLGVPDDEGSPAQGAPRHPARAVAVLAMGAVVAVGLSLGVLRCPSATILRVPCPACGSTRALHALAHGDLAGVARWNPVAPVAVAALVALGAQTAWAAYREGTPIARLETPFARWTVRVLLACVALELSVWLARFAGFLGGPVPV